MRLARGLKIYLLEKNIKMALSQVLERDSENSTPRLDLEPKKIAGINPAILILMSHYIA